MHALRLAGREGVSGTVAAAHGSAGREHACLLREVRKRRHGLGCSGDGCRLSVLLQLPLPVLSERFNLLAQLEDPLRAVIDSGARQRRLGSFLEFGLVHFNGSEAVVHEADLLHAVGVLGLEFALLKLACFLIPFSHWREVWRHEVLIQQLLPPFSILLIEQCFNMSLSDNLIEWEVFRVYMHVFECAVFSFD